MIRLRSVEDVRSLPEQSMVPSKFVDALECVNENKVIVAAGFIRLTSEVVIVVNPEAPRKDRVESVGSLIGAGVFRSERLGLTDMHAFLTGEHQKELARLLKKSYGFTGHTGEVLVLNL